MKYGIDREIREIRDKMLKTFWNFDTQLLVRGLCCDSMKGLQRKTEGVQVFGMFSLTAVQVRSITFLSRNSSF